MLIVVLFSLFVTYLRGLCGELCRVCFYKKTGFPYGFSIVLRCRVFSSPSCFFNCIVIIFSLRILLRTFDSHVLLSHLAGRVRVVCLFQLRCLACWTGLIQASAGMQFVLASLLSAVVFFNLLVWLFACYVCFQLCSSFSLSSCPLFLILGLVWRSVTFLSLSAF